MSQGMELEIKRLHAEVARLTGCLERANAQAERFEREWYLRGDVLEAANHRLGSLLAVIHRDGGHYESEHGTEKACADAATAVHALRQQAQGVDELAMLVRRLARALQKAAPDSDLPKTAVDYLSIAGLAGSPMRAWGSSP